MEVHQRIRDLREDADKKQAEIAELLETTQHQYSKYERDIQEIPVRHIITLAKYYNVSADYILGLTSHKTPLYNKTTKFADNGNNNQERRSSL